jgi:integrase
VAEVRHTGKATAATEGKVTFGQMAEMLLTNYRNNGMRSIRSAALSIRHLREFFDDDIKALDIESDRIEHYIAMRKSAGAENASVNRELSALKRMFTLAIKAKRLTSRPYVAMLEEDNTRQGFVSPTEFRALHAQLPEYLRDPVSFLYLSGWRSGELKSLEWRNVDMAAREIRLDPARSKSKHGRVLPLRGELLAIFERAKARRIMACPFVFHYAGGLPIGDFRKVWRVVCKASGNDNRLVHDLRRSAVRNMIRAGVSDRIAMTMSGHRTRSVFDRYDITSTDDLEWGTERTQEYVERSATTATVVAINRGKR